MPATKISKAKWTGSVVALITVLALGITTAISIALVFPTWGLPIIIIIGLGTTLTESFVFWRAVRKVFKLLFSDDLWPSSIWRRIKQRLELDIALRELKKEPKKLYKELKLEQDADEKAIKVALRNKQTEEDLLAYLDQNLGYKTQKKTRGVKRILGLFNDRYCKGVTLKREFVLKKRLLAISLALAILNGVGFSFVIFANIAEAFAAFGLTVSVAAGAPLWPLLLCTVMAVIAGVAGAALMYKTLAEAITDNIFKRIWASIKKTCQPEKAWSNLSHWEKLQHVLGCIFKLGCIILVLGIGIFVTIATAGTLLESSAATFAAFCNHSSVAVTVANTVINGFIVWVAYLPVDIIFGVEHSFSTIEKLSKIFSLLYQAIVSEAKQLYAQPGGRFRVYAYALADFLCSPLKWMAALICLIFFAAFLLHLIGSGAVNGQASNTGTDPFSIIINKITDFLNRYCGISISAGVLAATLTAIDEGGQDADFLLPESEDQEVGHEHGINYQQIYDGLVSVSDTVKSYGNSAINLLSESYQSLFAEEKTPYNLLDPTSDPQAKPVNP